MKMSQTHQKIRNVERITMKLKILAWLTICGALLPVLSSAQVNSGSNGSDGVFNPATNTVINMANHPNGIYQYTSVTISNGVTVTFIPNENNSPVTWLVQGNCEIDGTVDVSGQSSVNYSGVAGAGGPGGWAGGNGGSVPTSGQGPGGGSFGSYGAFASYGSLGSTNPWSSLPPGSTYGNNFLLPLQGGSGGGGSFNHNGGNLPVGGGGGGGAILIAASGQIILTGGISANGGSGGQSEVNGYYNNYFGGGGSGGAARLVSSKFIGSGGISVGGASYAGSGRIRLDVYENSFGGSLNGVVSQGFQPIIIPVAGQGVQLSIASVAGAAVSATPNGQLVTPDAIISGQQANPIPIVVNCANLPLNTLITVTVKPASGASVSAVGYNTAGTLASSTATVSLTMPRGGGIIYATAATGN